ncbi:MAG: B3/4 domain-containing protein [Eubacteriales bacterium]|jgi:DNA/RNA-binding domain of Phe-tRNA-synthetase-like protein
MTEISLSIHPQLKERCPGAALGCLLCDVQVTDPPAPLLEEIDALCRQTAGELTVGEIAHLDTIALTRAAYKACGKDPARYRNSCEALLRRVVQGKGLYRVNNVVDAGNLISLESGWSLGLYNADAICGPVVWEIAGEGQHYRGIGKDELNIAGLPVLRDEQGPFGCPTSDSRRTMVGPDTHRVLLCIYGFDGGRELLPWLDRAASLLRTHAAGQPSQPWLVE